MSKGKAQIVNANRVKAAQAGMKGMQASVNPPIPKPLGATPAAPPKTAPKSPKSTASVVPNASGTKTKNPGENPGGGHKLGNHF